MRWLRGMPAGELTAFVTGDGFCAGSGKRVRSEDLLLVSLAGYAAEAGCFAERLDLERTREISDFIQARELIESTPLLRGFVAIDGELRPGAELRQESVEEALKRHFLWASELIWEHYPFLEMLAWRLADAGRLSARQVAATLREYGRALERETDALRT